MDPFPANSTIGNRPQSLHSCGLQRCSGSSGQTPQATAFKGRRFESIEAQNEFLAHWERNWAAKRIHGTERRQVQAMFEEDRAHLNPLPLLGIQYFSEAQRTLCDDGCVRVDHSSYAACPAAIGAKVLVRIYKQRIEIRDIHSGLLRTHARPQCPRCACLLRQRRALYAQRSPLAHLRADAPPTARPCRASRSTPTTTT